MGLLIAFGATLCWALAAFPFTALARIMPVSSLNHVRLLLAVILMIMLAMATEGRSFWAIFSGNFLSAWTWLGLSGLVALVLGDYFSFRSYAILGPQYGTILATLSPASALVFGIWLLKEEIGAVGITGMAITMVGIMAISLGRSQRRTLPDHGHGGISRGILFGFLAASCHGAGLALSKMGFLAQAEKGLPIGAIPASFIRVMVAMVLLFLISLVSGRLSSLAKSLPLKPKQSLKLLVATVFNPVLAVTLSMMAIQRMNVAVAQTIFAMVPLFTVGIAGLFYKEKIPARLILGVLAALIGVSILIWRVPIGHWLGG